PREPPRRALLAIMRIAEFGEERRDRRGVAGSGDPDAVAKRNRVPAIALEHAHRHPVPVPGRAEGRVAGHPFDDEADAAVAGDRDGVERVDVQLYAMHTE